MIDLHFNQARGRKVLIAGDVCSGKTTVTARLLREATETVEPHTITVIEMAPRRREFKGMIVGGRLTDLMLNGLAGVRLLLPRVDLYAPRIEGTDPNHVLRLAKSNAELIQELLEKYHETPTPVLFINDVSMYLHSGDVNNLLKVLSLAKTAVTNSYQGSTLEDDKRSGLSNHERVGLMAMKKIMDININLQADSSSRTQITAAR